jgi:hypothetical protein
VVVGWPILQKVTFIDCWFCWLEVALLGVFGGSSVNCVVYCEKVFSKQRAIAEDLTQEDSGEHAAVGPCLGVGSGTVSGTRVGEMVVVVLVLIGVQ